MPARSRILSKPPLWVWIGVLLAQILGGGVAVAQSAACERYKAELASLNRGGSSARLAETSAQRQRGEIERLVGYYRSIGCDKGGFLFFRPPAECGPIAAQIRVLQSNYQSLVNQVADPSLLDERRRQLRAAISKACDASLDTDTMQPTKSVHGGRLVCVRSCDGAYFPLDTRPKGNVSPAAMCGALCPNAEMAVFRAPLDGGIEEAVSDTGEPYMKMPNALRYRKTYDPNCTCRKADEGWAKTLQKAEGMIARKKTDVIVTESLSEQMANASLKGAKTKRERSAETAINPAPEIQAISGDPDITGSVGTSNSNPHAQSRRQRIIAPDVIPVPLQ